MFQKDDYVVHGLKGVCQVKEVSRLDFVSNKDLYYTLIPVYDHQTLLYVPVNSDKIKLREVLTREEAKRWLMELPKKDAVWYADDRERKSVMERAMTVGNQEEWSLLVNGIYQKKMQKIDSGKRLTDRERELYRSVQGILLGELAQMLGSTPEKIEECILSDSSMKVL